MQTPSQKVIETKRFVRRMGDDGNWTPEYQAELDNEPRSSAAVERVSGVSNALAPRGWGKVLCAFLTRRFQSPGELRSLQRMQLVASLPPTGRVYTEKDRQGRVYYRVKAELPRVDGRRRQVAVHLGKDSDVAAWAREILEDRRQFAQRPKQVAIDQDRVERLRGLRRALRPVAKAFAAKAGYGFRGYRLVERKA